ncbi:trehalose-phosphatase [Ideonella azotifigens]|uniref:Trehalose 6-phosphate phosphatase n=1 Tax=Ideonella azotifigens TaxID=513160 RepID=A0ABP3VQD8_9BURK|nr:trehalose-phosphatase [Ideonella azotifigens]MCD2340426.1 trehalose-phosphatase [Ideonella azotifigens]
MKAPDLPGSECALFFDFDGTLVDLAPTPDTIAVLPRTAELLFQLKLALNGALAIVSGRPVSEIDHYLHSLKLTVAGVHGTELRVADGPMRRMPVASLDAAAVVIARLCEQHPALLMERKPGAIALHYRQAPALEDMCLAVMEEALLHAEGMALLRGKFVVEMKPSRATKAAAVHALMDCKPFRLRRPWFFGDDVTDESAFELVQSMGGVAIKIGEGETLASHRLANPAELHDWLAAAAAQLGAQQPERFSR